jgi:polyphosphate glucokinase
MKQGFGIDIGGSGIKGAPVNLETGALAAERLRIPTPQPSLPDAVAEVAAEIVQRFGWKGSVGCAFPAVVKAGRTMTAANVDAAWIDCPAAELLAAELGRPVVLLNDADAAGLAEMRFGAGRGIDGLVIMLTLGTGIGSAIFMDGRLVPNTEFGHLEIRGKKAEHRASDRVRKEKKLDYEDWAGRLQEYLRVMEDLFWPDLFILGGGVSKKHERFLRYVSTRTPVVPAKLRNDAGIVGAAYAASSDDWRS